MLTAGTISTPWTPVSGPAADGNGAGPDTKNLDVGDVSDVSNLMQPDVRTLLSTKWCRLDR